MCGLQAERQGAVQGSQPEVVLASGGAGETINRGFLLSWKGGAELVSQETLPCIFMFQVCGFLLVYKRDYRHVPIHHTWCVGC